MAARFPVKSAGRKKMPVFMNEVRAMGLEISRARCQCQHRAFRAAKTRHPLWAGRHQNSSGEQAAEAIVAGAAANGPFLGLIRFLRAHGSPRGQSQSAGNPYPLRRLRCFGYTVPGCCRYRLGLARAAAIQSDRQTGQGNLLRRRKCPGMAVNRRAMPDCPPCMRTNCWRRKRIAGDLYERASADSSMSRSCGVPAGDRGGIDVAGKGTITRWRACGQGGKKNLPGPGKSPWP